MQAIEIALGIVGLLLYFLLLMLVAAGIMAVLTAAVGLVGGILSIPVLYLLPDVRRFLVQASGGRPDDRAWRVVLRPRYLFLAALFGISYGFAVVVLLEPVTRLGLFPAAGEPTAGLVVIPVFFTGASALLAYGVHRLSDSWPDGASTHSVLAQWVVFLGVVVTAGTAVALVAAT